MNKVTVLIVDDSALMRKLLAEILCEDPAIEVVGTVSDAMQARSQIKALNPDVVTLDVEMPGMNGISFLERIMTLRPMPVVMISAMTQTGADTTMKALMLGAVDFVGKPRLDGASSITTYADEIRSKVKAAAEVSMPAVQARRAHGTDHSSGAHYRDTVIAIGASTGGVEAIYKVLSRLPCDMPPILVSQHIPPMFSTSFARRLNEQTGFKVCEATNGEAVLKGHVYIAPGDQHLILGRRDGKRICKLSAGPRVNRHIPSVDVLFNSVAEQENRSVGVLLTGMGEDGARGLGAMRKGGATTIVQDQETSVVWGMPGAAANIGAAEKILPLNEIASGIVEAVSVSTVRTREERVSQ